MLQATAEFVDLGGTGGNFVQTTGGASTKVRAV